MYKLSIDKLALNDLTEMKAKGGEARICAARIAVFLKELKDRPEWLNELLSKNFANDVFNVDKYVEFWDAGLDLWRLALFEFDLERDVQWQMPYRILYAYDQPDRIFRVLGIAHRSFNYKADHEFTKRICRTYDDLALPKHRVGRATYGRPGNKSH